MTTKPILDPTEFKITAKVTKSDGTEESVEISNFSDFVERTFELPSGIKSSDVTTVLRSALLVLKCRCE